MSLIKVFKTGQQYRILCPMDKKLVFSFPEIKVITYLNLAIKYMPPIIIILFLWQYYMNAGLAITIITAIFAISLPLQGFFWLGKRACSPLPLNLLFWYNRIKKKLIDNQIISAKNNKNEQLNFMEFMKFLNLAKLHFGHYLDFDDDQDTLD